MGAQSASHLGTPTATCIGRQSHPSARTPTLAAMGGAGQAAILSEEDDVPTASPRYCSTPGCKRYATKGGYCDQHARPTLAEARAIADSQRGNSAARGYGRMWRTASDGWIAHHPFCSVCGVALPRRLMVVDHVVPHRGDMALFWDRSNWQTLCKACHDRKTASGS